MTWKIWTRKRQRIDSVNVNWNAPLAIQLFPLAIPSKSTTKSTTKLLVKSADESRLLYLYTERERERERESEWEGSVGGPPPTGTVVVFKCSVPFFFRISKVRKWYLRAHNRATVHTYQVILLMPSNWIHCWLTCESLIFFRHCADD